MEDGEREMGRREPANAHGLRCLVVRLSQFGLDADEINFFLIPSSVSLVRCTVSDCITFTFQFQEPLSLPRSSAEFRSHVN